MKKKRAPKIKKKVPGYQTGGTTLAYQTGTPNAPDTKIYTPEKKGKGTFKEQLGDFGRGSLETLAGIASIDYDPNYKTGGGQKYGQTHDKFIAPITGTAGALALNTVAPGAGTAMKAIGKTASGAMDAKRTKRLPNETDSQYSKRMAALGIDVSTMLEDESTALAVESVATNLAGIQGVQDYASNLLAEGGEVKDMKMKKPIKSSKDFVLTMLDEKDTTKKKPTVPPMQRKGLQKIGIGIHPQNKADGGEIDGPGTEKSDSIPAKVKPGSFVVPAENAHIAALLDEKVFGKENKANLKQKGGTPVKLSDNEYLFTPEKKNYLQSVLGIDLNQLAPNAKKGMNKAEGGTVESILKEIIDLEEKRKQDKQKKLDEYKKENEPSKPSQKTLSGVSDEVAEKKRQQYETALSKYKRGREILEEEYASAISNVTKSKDDAYKRILKAAESYKKDPNSTVNKFTGKKALDEIKQAAKEYKYNASSLEKYEKEISEKQKKYDSETSKPIKLSDTISVKKQDSNVSKDEDLSKVSDTQGDLSDPFGNPNKGTPNNYSDKTSKTKKSTSAAKALVDNNISSSKKTTDEEGYDFMAEVDKVNAQKLLAEVPKQGEDLDTFKTQTSDEYTEPLPTTKKKGTYDISSGLDLGLGIGQTAIAIKALLGDGSRPVDSLSSDYLNTIQTAKDQAAYGFSDAESTLAKQDIESNRRAMTDAAVNLSGGNFATSLANTRVAGNVASRNLVELAAADNTLKLQKQRYRDSLIEDKVEKDRRLFEDKLNAFNVNQQAGSEMLQSGLQSIQNSAANRRSQKLVDSLLT